MVNDAHFESIYNEFKNLVYNLSLQYVLNTEDAQDITQEVFVKVYRQYHQYDSGKASLKTWIYRITINHCLDFLKTRKSKKGMGFFSALFHPSSNEPITDVSHINHPGIETEEKEALQNLLLIIQTLPKNQMTAIILSKIEDRSQKEVAIIMNISVKALESLLQRAKQSIKNKLHETEGF